MKKLALTILISVAVAAPSFAQGSSYVVKVTPTLVYLNGDLPAAAAVDERLIILRPQPSANGFKKIAEVSILEVYEKVVIAEILTLESEETIELLDVAIAKGEWKGPAANPPPTEVAEGGLVEVETEDQPGSRIGIYATGGYQREWGTDLRPMLTSGDDARATDNAGFGMRLTAPLTESLGVSATYKYADSKRRLEDDLGDILGWYQLNQHSMELDLHYPFCSTAKFRPYLGGGVGLHYLKLTGAKIATDTSVKAGGNLLLGAECSITDDWVLFYEHGYQYIYKGDDQIDLSNLKTYIGMGYRFRRW